MSSVLKKADNWLNLISLSLSLSIELNASLSIYEICPSAL